MDRRWKDGTFLFLILFKHKFFRCNKSFLMPYRPYRSALVTRYRTMTRVKRAKIVSRNRGVSRRRYRGSLGANIARARIGSTNVHRFSRWVGTPQTLSCTASTYESAGIFQLSDLPNVSEFTTLYDRYMLTHVQARVQLITNPNAVTYTNSAPGAAVTGTNWYPKFWWCPDYDDSSAESLEALKQRSKTKCIILQPNKQFTINIKPACLVKTYGSLLADGYDPKWRQWIDMSNTSVAHYGYKYVVDMNGYDPNDSYPFKVQIEYKYWFTCKDVR